ncbi:MULTISPECIES: branched-chain amino acid ABC transporter permease [unclassified Variovorax]|uniref:branched-chain amino acid ABC transporter permease n=1 Tax=unclassified Variovorax TaxID=663243 RepID=UPI001BD3E0D5|nr:MULTISPECIES: branched-chain amino acid ABC transporter permease [unclassified Variovorax]
MEQLEKMVSTKAFWSSRLQSVAFFAMALLAPLLLDAYYIDTFSTVLIYAIAGIGLTLLSGVAGQVSLAHAAFVGIGAYLHVYLLRQGLPLPLAMVTATLVTAFVGFLFAFPVLRMPMHSLAVCTLAFASIVEHVFVSWESFTNGVQGALTPKAPFLGFDIAQGSNLYFVCVVVLAVCVWLARNIIHSATGRAWMTLRESEPAARALGINVTYYKTLAFALSSGFAGVAGALFAHRVSYLSPDVFTVAMSIEMFLMIVVGGLGSVRGAIVGAFLVGLLPAGIAVLRDYLPQGIGNLPGLEPGIFGIILVFVILFEPEGIEGRLRSLARKGTAS